MMVGSTWQAKMKPKVLTSIRLPKMNLLPSLTKLSTFTKPWPIASNTSLPPGTSSTTAAKAICRPTPVATSFQSTRRLLFEDSHAMPISTARPNRPKATRVMASTQFSPMRTRNRQRVVIVRIEACSTLTLRFCPIAALAQSPAAQKHDLLLENFQLVDVETGDIRREQLLLIDGDRIAAIVPSSERGALSARSTIDLNGRYLIPGLWDMHVHFEGTDLIEDNALLLPVYLAYGITAVRDAASDLATEVLQWRGEVDRGVRPGPKIFTAGQKFEGIDSIWKGDLEVGDRKSMLEGMDKLEAMQVDFIKITDNTMEPGLFLETIKEARKRGHLVSAHVPVGATIEQLADAGLSSIEHASYVLRLGYAGEAKIAAAARSGEMSKQQANDAYKEGFDQELAKKGYRMLAKKGVAVTPTLIGEWQLAYLKETDHSKDSFQRFLTKDFMSKYQWRIDRMAGETAADREARKARYQLTARQLPLLPMPVSRCSPAATLPRSIPTFIPPRRCTRNSCFFNKRA